ncbi:MAG: chemical-damaging agent resistance protein C [Beggiatoa sp. IS2]|nr:MAG: chemical-damaging agent resistance protein C [Beggiatoa sp. IS2]
MSISLTKGNSVSLTKTVAGLKRILIGLGWNVRSNEGAPFDLDASVFLLQASSKVSSDEDFIFYNHRQSACGSVEHLGDNRTGVGEGDDERMKVNLATLPAGVTRIVVGVTIYDAASRQQNFGMVQNAYIRVLNEEDGVEIANYRLTESASQETAMLFGELLRVPKLKMSDDDSGDEWQFQAIGQGSKGTLASMAMNYGVNIG